jgi:hypothetical protein
MSQSPKLLAFAGSTRIAGSIVGLSGGGSGTGQPVRTLRAVTTLMASGSLIFHECPPVPPLLAPIMDYRDPLEVAEQDGIATFLRASEE